MRAKQPRFWAWWHISTALLHLLVVELLLSPAAVHSGAVVPPPLLYSYDLTYTNSLPSATRFEHVHTTACLAGLANRDEARLFTPLVTGNAVDSYSTADVAWREYLTQPGEWLANTTWRNITGLEELVTRFRQYLHGVVLYDPQVPATSSLASTAAGVESLLPVCYQPADPESIYSRIVTSGPRLPVTLNLTGKFRQVDKTGPTPKIAAYRWARQRWLSPTSSPRANVAKLGYYADYWAALQGDRLKATPGLPEVANHDYFVSQRAFFFDLSVWADEAPVDDPTQALGDDKAELVAIFEACYAATQASGYNGPEMLHVGGFTPWFYKYTSDGQGCPHCKHKGVETEWETMGIVGAYNAFDDGDACCVGTMANSAMYMHYPLENSFKQNAKPTVASLKAKGLLRSNGEVARERAFAAYYAGDYDGAAWLYNQLLTRWDDPKRGTVPIGWAIDSELSMRFPVIFKHIYETKTANDFFISGDSGAGYLNPTLLLPDPKTGRRGESNITKSGAEAWITWNTNWYQKFDLSFTGFLINGDQGPLTNDSLKIYDSFSPDGVVVSTAHDPVGTERQTNGGAWTDAAGTPVVHHVLDMPGNATEAAEQVAGIVKADRVVKRSSLQLGDSLQPNAVLSSANGNAWLHNQLDGNVVLINPQLKPLWSTRTVDESCAPQNCKAQLKLTEKGQLQLMAANGTVVWAPLGISSAARATQLIVQDDCNLVLKGDDQKVLWASGTQCTTELRARVVVQGPPPQSEPQPLFYVLRNILQSASYMADAAEIAIKTIPNMTFVDPYTLGLLVKCHTGAIDCSH